MSSTHQAISSDLPLISARVQSALERVHKRFEESLHSPLPPVQRLIDHLESYRGKMLRPALVVLCGLAAGEDEPSDAHITVAAVCEMIHMATLVHDDVLDEADTRRKGATVNRLRGNETAVILGDYLFSSAYRLCSTLDSQTAALLIGACGVTLCTGELLQLHHRDNLSLDEPTYFEIVKRKTGSLISVACRLGAMQSLREGAPGRAQMCERFAEFGMLLGVAFQIQDDLLDLTGNQAVVGKPIHRDLELGKLTLPMIHHLRTAPPQQHVHTIQMLENPQGMKPSGVQELVKALNSTGSIIHAREHATGLVQEAKAVLASIPESGAKATLMLMADQVIARSS